MNEEIKEVLEALDKIAKGVHYPEDLLYYENCQTLLDYITNLQEEIKRLNGTLNQADNKNLELIELINKIYDVIENKDITGIEARLKIQEILGGDE